jgi:hypothetical protein
LSFPSSAHPLGTQGIESCSLCCVCSENRGHLGQGLQLTFNTIPRKGRVGVSIFISHRTFGNTNDELSAAQEGTAMAGSGPSSFVLPSTLRVVSHASEGPWQSANNQVLCLVRCVPRLCRHPFWGSPAFSQHFSSYLRMEMIL